MDLAFDVSIDPDGAIKAYDALEVYALPQKRNILAALSGLLAPFFRCPHDRLLKLFPCIDGRLPYKSHAGKYLNNNIPLSH
jgi:hypothetical protein